jgi:phosphatidylglycerophosphatase C
VKRIAFFDFDGTITTKDTLLELIKYQAGVTNFYLGVLVNAPFLFAYKLKIIPRQLAKEKILAYFFRGKSLALFQSICDLFTVKVLPSLIRPKAIAEIKKLLEMNFEVVVVSASAENWIKKWCDEVEIKLIATQLESRDNLLTGNLKGNNCHGEEKVIRIRSAYNLSQYQEIYCYGDSNGDKAMLTLATRAFYKPFR